MMIEFIREYEGLFSDMSGFGWLGIAVFLFVLWVITLVLLMIKTRELKQERRFWK